MPIFEYKCEGCGEEFEKLVSGSKPEVICPRCNSKNIIKKFSLFGMSGVEKQTSTSGSGCTSCSSSSCSSCH
ncbi:MAG: zinc ribbon domain-containing protein [Thermodesulfovibrionia bacterium]|nr:zinc ribbon domain-containing protein [Thermodesulfovibrionia bacterium]